MGVGLLFTECFCLLQGCGDIDALVLTEGRQEPYIVAADMRMCSTTFSLKASV